MLTKRFAMILAAGVMLSALGHGESISAISVSNGLVQNNGIFSLGWEFSLAGPLQITALGFYDGDAPGFTEAHEVAIFSCVDVGCTAGTQVVTATVPQSGGLFVDGFWYQALDKPFTINSGLYVITGLSHNEKYTYNGQLTVASGITFIENRFIHDLNSELLFPTAVAGNNGFFGPNFQFTVTPEPGTIVFVSAGLLIAGLARKRLLRVS